MKCPACGGEGSCKPNCPVLQKLKEFSPKIKEEFEGSSPPEIFVGRFNYPQVNVGILSPAEFGDTSDKSMVEKWFAKKMTIPQIFAARSSMIYSRFKAPIKFRKKEKNFQTMQEVAMAAKPTSMEFKLNKRPIMRSKLDKIMPMIGNPALLKSASFQENVKVEKKVDYLVNDTDAKAATSISELHKSRIPISNIIKVLSAGLLGKLRNRKLVPTRWAITATDNNISGILLKNIKHYSTIQDFRLFNGEYLDNHYEILMIPQQFSYEVIEAKVPGSIWNPHKQIMFMKDYESYFGRKDYASEVAGGYYAPRLAITEYLQKIKRQASIFIMREVRPGYNLPCGVGILREITRDALTKKHESFNNLNSALTAAQKRMHLPVSEFTKQSLLLKEVRHQRKLIF
ncbi:hypothetical protein ACFLZZ_02625 [Nanoarchaeota archaeon]